MAVKRGEIGGDDSSGPEPENEVRGAEEAERSETPSWRRRRVEKSKSSDGESLRRSSAIRQILSVKLAVEVVGVVE